MTGTDLQNNISISEEDLRRFRALFVRSLWRELREVYAIRKKENGFNQQKVADRLGVHKSVISKRLRGESNITLEVLSDMARALDCRPDVAFERYEELAGNKDQWKRYAPTTIDLKISSTGEEVIWSTFEGSTNEQLAIAGAR